MSNWRILLRLREVAEFLAIAFELWLGVMI